MANKAVVALSVTAGVLALGIAAGSIALVARAPSGTASSGQIAPSPSATGSPRPEPTPSPTATSPAEAMVDKLATEKAQPENGVSSPQPDAADPGPAPDVVPVAGPGEHVVTFTVTSSTDEYVPISFYTVGGDPSTSNSDLWVWGERMETTWVRTPWTHSVIIPAGGDPMTNGWGLYLSSVPSGMQASCQATMDGTLISSASTPTWKCEPGRIG